MDIDDVTTITKTWMLMCLTKAEILSRLIKTYSMSQREAEQLYQTCLEELGR